MGDEHTSANLVGKSLNGRHILTMIAEVGSHLPTYARATIAMHIHKWSVVGIGRYLIINETMVDTAALSRFHLRCPTYELAVVVDTLMLNDRTANREMSMFLYYEILCVYIQGEERENGQQCNYFHLLVYWLKY